jgi:hypothetical protein
MAKLAAAAAYRAIQLTSKLDLKSKIVIGEDQEPIIEFHKEVIPISPVTVLGNAQDSKVGMNLVF